MAKILIVFLCICSLTFANQTSAQKLNNDLFPDNSGEQYFSISVKNPDIISKLTKLVSIDNVKGDTVFAYANKGEFDEFLKLQLPWTLLPKPGDSYKNPRMLNQVKLREIDSWNFYPTYDAYLDMMNQFESTYPDLCEVVEFGQSENGRKLLALKISDNISTREAEPQFLYTGTMHGDELVGYVLFLRLADYLLSNYMIDSEITSLINNTEIWINPLANPDGTFAGGNNTVNGSTRYNANYVDLNRNYPDPEDGQHPDGNEWQAETMAFMQLAEDNNFVMSANTHGGAEVINYPWDTWPRLAADNNWWIFACREYADTVHNYAPSSYLDGYDNGITNGYAWYTTNGNRQDYMNYFHHCREATFELSNVKKLQASLLSSHWDWNFRSLINYIKQCNYGLSGVVTDESTGKALSAKVFIDGHDMDNSFVYADSANGFYQRLLDTGTYNISFSAEGYYPITIQNVEVARYACTNLNVQLNTGELTSDFSVDQNYITKGSLVNFSDHSFGSPLTWSWIFEGATPAFANEQNPANISYSQSGGYDVSLSVTNASGETHTQTKTTYIHVSAEIVMSAQSISIYNGIFFDSGGEGLNYPDNEDIVMSIYPGYEAGQIEIEFLDFNLEEHSSCNYDWLKIYDGISTEAPLMGSWCGSDLPGTITATNPQGALTFQFHSDQNVNKPGWKALLNCRAEQTLELSEGWNALSLFVTPDDTNFENLFSEAFNDLIVMIGDEGMLWPSLNINTLKSWNSNKGYIIKMRNSHNFSISGKMNPEKNIYFQPGWNLLPVTTDCSTDVNNLFGEHTKSFKVLKEVAGIRTYWPEMNIYNPIPLEPGKAYILYLNQATNFSFPSCK